jgi:hypothetical protein
MVIFTTVSYPSESAKELATKFLEAPQVPDFMTKKGPYVRANRTDGVIVTSLYELDNSKLADGMDYLGNYMATYFGVPGFMYDINPHYEVNEAMKMIGM